MEANTVWNFGPRLGLEKAEEVLACHAVCSQYGLDIDGTAAVISFAMSCLEKGLLTQSSTDTYMLQRGNFKAITAIIKDIAYRQGLGELLSEGSLRAAKNIGQNAESLAFHVKGQDLYCFNGKRGSH